MLCARAAHNVMVTYCKMHGDHTILEWDDAEDWQRRSTVDMVRSVLAGNYSPRAEHERWLRDKVRRGYVWGPRKNDDPEAGPLTNPNVMEYDEIPFVQRMKNHLLIVVAAGTASHYGIDVSRVVIPEMAAKIAVKAALA